MVCAARCSEVSGINSGAVLRTNIGMRWRDARLGTSRRVIESGRTVEVEPEIAAQQAREAYRGATSSRVLRCSTFEASYDVQDLQSWGVPQEAEDSQGVVEPSQEQTGSCGRGYTGDEKKGQEYAVSIEVEAQTKRCV